MHKNNFYNLIMCCFKVIAGQTWQNVTSENRPQMSDLFCDVTEGQYTHNQWRIMKIQQVATLCRITICSCMHLSIVLQT